MTQQQAQTQQNQQTQLLAGFNYADPNSAGDYLSSVKLEENKPVLLAFLNNVPGMQAPPIVYCKVHWNSEMGEKGTRFQCFGGQCCEQITWQKGFKGQPGKFAPNKASTRYYIPCVTYEPDPMNQTQMKAIVKYMDMTWTAYNSFIIAMKNTEGISFFERDVIVTAKKVNGATDYSFDKRDGQAQWIVNPEFNKQVNDQLPAVAERLLQSMPKLMSEAEFLAIKPTLDAKVQAAMATHTNPQAQTSPQAQFGALPQGFVQPQTVQQAFTQPQVNIPVQQFTQPQVNIPVQPQTVQQAFTQPNVVNTVPEHPFVEQVQPQTVQQAFTQPQVNIPTPVVTPIQTTETQLVQPIPPVVEVQSSMVNQETLDFDPSALLNNSDDTLK